MNSYDAKLFILSENLMNAMDFAKNKRIPSTV